MKQNSDLLQQVITKYRLDEPIPFEVQDYMFDVKKDNLKKILQRAGGYTIVFGLILVIFFSLKKLGIGISIAKSALVLLVTTTIATASISTGAYYSVKYVKKHIEEQRQKEKIKEETIDETKDKPAEKKIIIAHYDIGIRSFETTDVDPQIVNTVNNQIAMHLIKFKGKDKIVDLRKNQGNYQKLLTGRIEKVDNMYTISARVIDAQTKEVLLSTSEYAASDDEIPGACSKIAGRLAKMIK